MSVLSAAPSVVASARHPLCVRTLGLLPYREAWTLQKELVAQRVAGEGVDSLLLLEHPPVYTLGRNSLEEHILVPRAVIAARGATVERCDRGGEVTFHGPGQLVAYPIMRLEGTERSISWLVDVVERAIVDTLAVYGVQGTLVPGQRGVWTRGRKIASVGLSLKRWVVFHGVALNVAPDLSAFALINPCGHAETVMTSLAMELEHPPTVAAVGATLAHCFALLCGRDLVEQ